MKSIVVTYPYFQSLPKGLKMLLVESEGFFFQEMNSTVKHPNTSTAPTKAARMNRNDVLRFRTGRRRASDDSRTGSPEEQSFSE